MKHPVTLPILFLLCFTQLINLQADPNQAQPVAIENNLISRTVTNSDEEVITFRSNQDLTVEDLCKPMSMRSDGTLKYSSVTCFLKHTINHEKYVQDVIPEIPFAHLEQFINHGIKTNQQRSYIKAVFRLFDKKFKAAPYINAAELAPFLQKLPELLKTYLIAPTKAEKKHVIKQVVRSELENHFEFLKQDPEAFLDQLAEKILCAQSPAGEVSCEQLRYSLGRFIETCLTKIIWSPTDKDEVWKTFVAIGRSLATLQEQSIIISLDDLDDLLWTLTTRFCLFLSISGSDLPVDFYEKARDDIRHGIEYFDKCKEQEDLITSKSAYLQDAIIKNAAKSYAKGRFGILTDTIVKK